MRKKLLVSLIALLSVGTLLTGCGKKKGEVTIEYIGEYNDIRELGDYENIGDLIIKNNKLYYTLYEYDEETYEETISYICRDFESGDETEIELPSVENGYISNMCVTDDENLLCLISTWTEDSMEYNINEYSSDGSLILEINLSDEIDMAGGDEYYYFYADGLTTDGDNNIYINDGNQTVYCFDGETGDKKFSIEMENYIISQFGTENGIYVISYDSEYTSQILYEISNETKAIEKEYTGIPSNSGRGICDENGNIYFNNGSVLYLWDKASDSYSEIINWIGSDIDGDQVRAFSILEDERIYAILRDWDENTVQEVYLTKTEVAPENARTQLTLGVFYLSYDLKSEVLKFNRTNKDYKIIVKEYSGYDYEEALTKMQADMSGKDAPDIIDATMVDTRSLAAQGYLVDLQPYFDRDYNEDDFVESAINAGKMGDALYILSPSFSISTTAAKTSTVNGKTEWTSQDFRDLIVNRPSGTNAFIYATKEYMLESLCNYDLDEFINWKTGECSFNSDTFIDILEICNEFPDEINYDDYTYMNYPQMIKNGDLIIFDATIWEAYEVQEYKLMADGDITFIGYPCNGGCSSIVSSSDFALAVSATCEDPDGAWEFMKIILSEDYQDDLSYSFPVRRSSLDKILEKAATPEYYTDENGNKVEVPKTSVGWDDWYADIYAATDEEIQLINDLIDNAGGTLFSNKEIFNIINEEAQAYFSGQKSASEVAEIIQSRVALYVGEML